MWMWELTKTDAGNGAETREAREPADAQLGAAHASSSTQPHATPIKTRPRLVDLLPFVFIARPRASILAPLSSPPSRSERYSVADCCGCCQSMNANKS